MWALPWDLPEVVPCVLLPPCPPPLPQPGLDVSAEATGRTLATARCGTWVWVLGRKARPPAAAGPGCDRRVLGTLCSFCGDGCWEGQVGLLWTSAEALRPAPLGDQSSSLEAMATAQGVAGAG